MQALVLKAAARRLLVPAYFGLLAVIVFGTQFAGTGFGNRLHHSWVSSHTLAIASHATAENGLVGHSRQVINENAALHFDYFDRNPVFFSALLGALTGLTNNLATKVWLARQLMHVFLVLTMLFAWLLLRRLGLGARLALVGVTLGFSGHMLLYYRGMIHFDQPALAGMMFLLYVIARVKLERQERWRWLTIATLLSLGMGRGIVSLGVAGLWAAIEAAGLLWQRERTAGQRLRAIPGHDATRMLLLGVVWSTLLVGYNLAQEMARRGVPLEQTSIIESIQTRRPGGELQSEWGADYSKLAETVSQRLLRWFLPLEDGSRPDVQSWLMVAALTLVLFHIRNEVPARRVILLLVAFSGLAWLFVMANLTWFHEYTTMHALGLALVFWLALLARVRQARVINILLLLSLALFLRNSLEVEARNSDHFRATAVYTEDYDRILRRIGRGQVVYGPPNLQDGVINRGRYTLGFYLGDNMLAATAAQADYLVSAREILALPAAQSGDGASGWRLYRTLTPENRAAFLFDREYSERLPPEDMSPGHNFGDEVALGRWQLLDSVQVRPCQRVNVESWWQADTSPSADYSMQLALVDEAGKSPGSSNNRLTVVGTGEWQPGVWYLDLRPLTVPCDAAGQYALVMNVYDSLALATRGPLALIDADGGVGNTWLYLTTLFIN